MNAIIKNEPSSYLSAQYKESKIDLLGVGAIASGATVALGAATGAGPLLVLGGLMFSMFFKKMYEEFKKVMEATQTLNPMALKHSSNNRNFNDLSL